MPFHVPCQVRYARRGSGDRGDALLFPEIETQEIKTEEGKRERGREGQEVSSGNRNLRVARSPLPALFPDDRHSTHAFGENILVSWTEVALSAQAAFPLAVGIKDL